MQVTNESASLTISRLNAMEIASVDTCIESA